MFNSCRLHIAQGELGYAVDAPGRTTIRANVDLGKAWPLTAPQTGGAMAEWHHQYLERGELYVGQWWITWNSLNSAHNYTLGGEPSDPRSRIYRYILTDTPEVRVSYFYRNGGENADRLQDVLTMYNTLIDRRGFYRVGGGRTGTGRFHVSSALFHAGPFEWQIA